MSKIKFSQQKQRAILVLGFYCKVVSTQRQVTLVILRNGHLLQHMDEIKFDTINDLGKKEAAAHDYISSRKKELEQQLTRERHDFVFTRETKKLGLHTAFFLKKKTWHGFVFGQSLPTNSHEKINMIRYFKNITIKLHVLIF